jgi:hypothetical protein
MPYRLYEKDLEKLYRIKIAKGKNPRTARYEVEQMRKLIKRYGVTTSGKAFKFGKDAYMDYDSDGIINAFDCQPLNPFMQGPEHFKPRTNFTTSFEIIMGNPEDKYTITTKYMTADEFLTLARKATIGESLDAGKSNEEFAQTALRQDKVQEYMVALKKGDKFPTPFLIYRGPDDKPDAHEGRHTIYAAAKAFGKKKKFPVHILKAKNQGF